ncbi:unnamed protein product [Fusarium graminearum]|nr:unnamed protein product [Fusarium graminearum]
MIQHQSPNPMQTVSDIHNVTNGKGEKDEIIHMW